MSIWGKILGGTAGFALGGPLAALFGAAAGHALDRISQSVAADGQDATQKIAFTIAVIALSAKMARVDGAVTEDEVAAFRRVFRVPPHEEANVRRVFDLARRDSRGFEAYAKQVAAMFRDRRPVLEELLDCLFYIARADGALSGAELRYLRDVSDIFGLARADFRRIRATGADPDDADPYAVLGVGRGASDEAVKAAYRKLVRDNHPDRLLGEGLPLEFVGVATDKMARINAAYDLIRQERAA